MTPADKAIAFIEKLRHPEKTEWFGQRVKLLAWQKDYIKRLLEVAETGNRIIRKSLLWLPKKNGKTCLLALLTVWFLFNEKNGQIICAANDKEQASILYKMVRSIIEQDAWLSKQCRVYKGNVRRVECWYSGSELTAVSSEAFTKNGLNCSVFVGDEVGFFDSSELWDAIESSQIGRSNPLMLGISTAGADVASYGYELYEQTRKAIANPSDYPNFLPIIYEGNAEKWNDVEEWYRCNPSLGELGNETFIRTQIQAAKDNPSELRRVLRYHLNVWTSAASEDPWLPIEKLKACNDLVDPQTLLGKECYIGIDLATRSDLTAVVALFRVEDKAVVLSWFFTPADTLHRREHEDKAPYTRWVRQGYLTTVPGDYMDSSPVFNLLQELNKKYVIREIGMDSAHNASDLTANLQAAGFPVEWVIQGWKTVVPAMLEIENLVMSKRFVYNNNPVLLSCFNNARVRMKDDAGNLLVSKKKSRGRIDGVFALIDAVSRELANRKIAPSISF
jgi:phage terminase large subunit-like protein